MAPSKPAPSPTGEQAGDCPAPPVEPAPLPALDTPGPPDIDASGARGRRPWTFGAAIVTGVAVALTVWAFAVRAGETRDILTLSAQIDSQVVSTSNRSHDLAAVMDMAERVYEGSDGKVADPATRDVLAQALTDARQAVAQRVTETPPESVTQARTLLAQASHIENSLDWAAQDLRVAVDMVQQSQGAQHVLESREPASDRTMLVSHDGS